MKNLLLSLALTLTLIAMIPAAAHAQEQDQDQEQVKGKDKVKTYDLEKVADNLKYNNALQFIRLNLQDKALQEFQEYLEVYIHGNNRADAYRHVAGIYFSRFDYQRAVKLYRELYEEFNNTEPGIEGFFNMGICYKKMGYDKKAEEIFSYIAGNYTYSNFASQARLQLDLINIINSN